MKTPLATSLLFFSLTAVGPALASEEAAPPQAEDALLQKLSPDQLKDYLVQRDHQKVALAQANNHGDSKVAILVPGFFFLSLILGVLAVLAFRFRREKQLHETLRLMIEKGAAIPPELLHPPRKQGSDLKRGLLLSGAGVGLGITLLATEGLTKGTWTVAFIPVLMGAGYLITWGIERRGTDPRASSEMATRA